MTDSFIPAVINTVLGLRDRVVQVSVFRMVNPSLLGWTVQFHQNVRVPKACKGIATRLSRSSG